MRKKVLIVALMSVVASGVNADVVDQALAQ